MGFVRRLQAGELEALADPLGELFEIERPVEYDAGAAIAVPAHLTLDRPQALDDHDDFLADAIFLDRRDLDAAERHIVHIDRVIGLADAHRGLARNFQARRPRTEAVTRL